MSTTPEQMALDALAELGEAPGPDPIAHLRLVAAEDGQRLDATNQLTTADIIGPDGQPTQAAADYEELLDRQAVALAALARIHHAGPRPGALLQVADLLDHGHAPTHPVHPENEE